VFLLRCMCKYKNKSYFRSKNSGSITLIWVRENPEGVVVPSSVCWVGIPRATSQSFAQLGRPVRPLVTELVCLSVCVSVKRVDCDKTEESSTQIFIMKDIIYPSFVRRRMAGWGRFLLPEIFGQTDPVRAKMSILNRHSLVTPHE